jgi:AcrR family transcriptional regulator
MRVKDGEAGSPLQEARKQAYRKVILDAAERVFADRGYEGSRIQLIADEAGVSVGTIYGVFGSKSDLFSTVLTRRLPELLEVTRAAALNAETPLQSLRTGTRAYIIFLLEHPDYLQIHLREHAWGLGPTRATREQFAAWDEGLELYAEVLKVAAESGEVIDEDPERLARCITAVHQVQLWDWVENGMTEPAEQVADRLDRLFQQMFCTDKGQDTR